MMGLASAAIEWFAIGALLAIAGALVKYRQWTFLVAGYDRTSPVPDEVVADVVGNTVLRIGIATVAIGAIIAFADPPTYLGAVFAVVVLVAVARLVYRLNTYDQGNAA